MSKMSESDTGAFAVLTPPGRGGIAVIRCVGPRAEAAVAAAFRAVRAGAADLPAPGALAYGHVLDADGRPIDEVILYREGPAALEVNCHGGPAAVRAVCGRLAALGLEQADPDRLLELEGAARLARDARRALRRATTPLAARILLDQLNGALARAVEDVARTLAPARGTSREDSPEKHGDTEGEAIASVDALLDRWRTCGRFLADPPRIAIAGRPNAGKSTLLNRLAGAERAITSAAPGTTRDAVEAEAALEGVPVVLVDTAGLGEPRSQVERAGVERARREAARAAAVVYLVDAAQEPHAEDEAALSALGGRALLALNKIDLCAAARDAPARDAPARGGIRISALTGEGVPALVGAILSRLGWQPPPPRAAVPFTAGQAEALHAARGALASGRADDARRHMAHLIKAP
ncbi:MAG: GTP-binding protein [Planctomycetes bacterium]|nr:GTP-binding protein [Planctomycetota bacterium]